MAEFDNGKFAAFSRACEAVCGCVLSVASLRVVWQKEPGRRHGGPIGGSLINLTYDLKRAKSLYLQVARTLSTLYTPTSPPDKVAGYSGATYHEIGIHVADRALVQVATTAHLANQLLDVLEGPELPDSALWNLLNGRRREIETKFDFPPFNLDEMRQGPWQREALNDAIESLPVFDACDLVARIKIEAAHGAERVSKPAAELEQGEGNSGGGSEAIPATKIQQVEAGEMPCQPRPRLTVANWSDLGVGIDKDGSYRACDPCPENGAVFPKESATVLELRGHRWQKLLELLALSENGNTASKQELMVEFGYLKRGEIPANDRSELMEDTHSMKVLKTASGRLTQAVADLGRNLRRQVEGPQGKSAPTVLSVADEGMVRAAFVVRHLLRGSDGKLHFGERRS